ncbi:M56 family metallopeptidase [Arundinibacter roseus]|uniref:M56 family peptidase n=1 Tax=Arundinibacter roseus TaxID=2070510 RepID=A0A4R4K7C5_9BACT|nr:M56 family metallopeptidase [Arundinibacter roseus]TDB63497.1 M56 family peptidase [Arundinibacter roseus]
MDFLLFIGKVSLYQLLLFGCYWLLLRRHTFFRWNRAYLLGSLLLSFVLPLVQYPEAAPELPVYEVTAVQYVVVAAKQSPSLFTWINLLWAVYAAGVVFMSVRLFRHFASLRKFIQKGDALELDGYTLILMDNDRMGSFSFLRWVVINRTDYERHFDTILSHELVHVQQRHSLDIVLVEVLRVAFWFNPILIFYKNALQQVHEFLADCELMPQRDRYAEFLVAYALNTPIGALTNHFFNSSLLKSRIAMLYKNRNSNWSLGKYAAVALLIGFVSLLAASCEREVVPTSNQNEKNISGNVNVDGIILDADNTPIPGASIEVKGLSTGTTTDVNGKFRLNAPAGRNLVVSFPEYKTLELAVSPTHKNNTFAINMTPGTGTEQETIKPDVSMVPSADGKSVKMTVQSVEANGQQIFTVVEENPEFPGGIDAMFKFLGENVKYPEAAARANVSGKVFLSFVVNTNGEIGSIQVLKGIGFGADEAAIRAVQNMPRWKPGMQSGKPVNVRYNLPINFNMGLDGKGEVGKATAPGSVTTGGWSKDAKPLIVVDGIEKAEDFSMNTLSPTDIQSINVLKDKAATDKYGVKGVKGVVEITTKK